MWADCTKALAQRVLIPSKLCWAECSQPWGPEHPVAPAPPCLGSKESSGPCDMGGWPGLAPLVLSGSDPATPIPPWYPASNADIAAQAEALPA